MDASKNTNFKLIATSAAQYIRDSSERYLQPSIQKDFLLWILANNNQHQYEYLKMLGVANSIELEISMMEGLVEQETVIKAFLPYLGILNAYFAFETIQDNLAIGLATWFKEDNPEHDIQYEILKSFNPIMISKLQGNATAVGELLMPYQSDLEKISAFQRCLSPQKMYQFAEEFSKYQSDPAAVKKLDCCFYTILTLNIQTSLDLAQSLRHHVIHQLLEESLIARYDAVHQLLSSSYLTPHNLADWGAKAILVLPTLVYCIGMLDSIKPNPVLAKVIKEGSLQTAIYSSALLVRLLNDIGTPLLNLNVTERKKFFKSLVELTQKTDYSSLLELLMAANQDIELAKRLIRIRKDIQYGEFNICLDGIKNINNIGPALDEFQYKVNFYSELYQQHLVHLQMSCSYLEQQFQNKIISTLIYNMFKFHEKMYSINFESIYGDYAILDNSGEIQKNL